MIIGTIKQHTAQADITLLKKLGYRTEVTRPGAIRIWRKKKENVQIQKRDHIK